MWRRFKILVGLLIVFVAGAAVGGVAVVRVVHKKVQEKTDSARWEPSTMAWLRKEASLTAEQETQVRPMVHETVEQLKSLRDRTESERKSIWGSMLLQVNDILNPLQREKLRAFIRHTEEKRATTPSK
jgi:hypothetical protein